MSERASFLAGGGELGGLMRAKDWSASPLGDAAAWPQSLRTAVSTCLASRYPMFLWWGPQMVNIYNDAYIPVLGDKHPGALGRPAPEVWSEIWDIIGPLARRVIEHGEATWSEDQLLHLEKRAGAPEENFFDFAYSPVQSESGAVAGLLGVVSETTGRVLGARRLTTLSEIAARTRGVQHVIDAATRAVGALECNPGDLPFAVLFDEDGAVLAHAGLRSADVPRVRTAVPVQEVLRRRAPEVVDVLPELVLPGDRPAPAKALVLPAEAGSATLALCCGLGRHRPLDAELHQFCELVAAAIGSAVADAAALEEERERARALAELDRAKTEFFSNVSHELRTPLTLMLGPLEDGLAGQPVDLDMVHRNALRLLRHVNGLLDFSRLQAGRIEAQRQAVDLHVLCTDVAGAFRSAVEKAGLALEVDCPSEPTLALVDAEQVEQILLNLLSNALKFTFEGSVAVRVRTEGGAAVIEVSDTGVGIDAADRERLFERFHRVQGARSRTYEGSGIGLALVRELVELQGGAISVDSTEDQGTTFTVRLPLAPDAPAAALEAPSGRAQAYVAEALRWSDAPADGGAAEGRGTAARVLVADDNADMRDYLRRLLSPSYEVVLAADGREALDLLRDGGADLVLSDVMMPRLDGFGLLRCLRENPATAHVPVVLLSARAGEEASVEGLDAGADDYVVKPFSARELLARVRANLELGAMRSAEATRAAEHADGLQRLLDQEHRITETLQRSMLPAVLADDPFTTVAGCYEPAQESLEIGGDFYDAIPLDDGRLMLVVGDVAGHGLEAAATMGQLRAALRSGVLHDPRPDALLGHLNALALGGDRPAMVTCQCVLLAADGLSADYAIAGHPPGLLLGPGAGVAELDRAAGPPLGVLGLASYRAVHVPLIPGSTIVLYTDGLIERRGESLADGQRRLRERAAALVGLEPADLGARLVRAERTDRPFEDDVALLVARVEAPGPQLDLELAADPASLAVLRRALRRWLPANGLDATEAYEVLLACHEAATNVVEHAYGLQGGPLHVHLEAGDDGVRVVIGDRGSWRSAREDDGGRGGHVMRGIMDEVRVDRGSSGSTVRMVKHRMPVG
ncbi:MAG TPA: SpoIIE family protein phosphatase [Baekduia sp.]|nr:SpoIIE family protein phosphatase [Baekduia sp.]